MLRVKNHLPQAAFSLLMIDYKIAWTPDNSPWSSITPPDPLNQGMLAHRQGQFEQAWTHYVAALHARPHRALAAHLIGLLQIERGMGSSSVPFLIRAHLLQPAQLLFCEALLYARIRSGKLQTAADMLLAWESRDLELDMSRWRHWLEQCQSGSDPASLGMPEPKLSNYEKFAESKDPLGGPATSTPIHAKLIAPFARILNDYRQGNYTSMLLALDPLLGQYPGWGEGCHMRGVAHSMLGQSLRAEQDLKRALTLLPGRSEIWDHLAILLARQDKREEAENAYEQSLALNPLRAESWNNAADGFITQESFDAAFQFALLAFELDPRLLTTVFNLGRAALGRGDLDYAERVLRKLLAADPRQGSAELKLAELCMLRGNYIEAGDHFERVIEINPFDSAAQSGLLFIGHYLDREPLPRLFERAMRYGELLASKAITRTIWSNSGAIDGKLRVGFVSGDFGEHPVGFFFVTIAEALARSDRLELFAYPTTRRTDVITDRIRGCFNHWVPIAGLNDQEASDRIFADGIDVLVDLSGHTAGNRLGVFVRKPAPVQVTWLGYFATTGLSQIDYLLSGPWDITRSEEAAFVERVWRLPKTRLCFSSPEIPVAVRPLPAASSGKITFGCFNNLNKMNEAVIRLWSRILYSVPGSTLYLKAPQLRGEQVRNATLSRFQALGIKPERLLLEGPSPMQDYLDAYGRLDIALDPFPYPGGTTTIQALWMGIPVLTMSGASLISRQGESLLRALGMVDWIALSEDDYLTKAGNCSRDLGKLAELRKSLRRKVEMSPLMDADGFAKDLDQALRAMHSERLSSTHPISQG